MSVSGPTSFGYRREGGKLVLDPIEAPIRKRIYDLFLEHRRKKTVAEILNADGAKTRNGSYFTGQTITRLLNDERVTGKLGEIEALISKDTFQKCQDVLKSQKGGAKRKPSHLFAGMAFCQCGDKMYVPSGSHKYVCRSCKAKIHKTDLEAVFIEQLRAHHYGETNISPYDKLYSIWPTLPLETKRAILEATTKRIVIERNKVTLSLVALYKT